MLGFMKKLIINSLLLLALTTASFANAALYRGLDAEGNVAYSDMPFEDSEKFTPPPISVVDTQKAEPEKKVVEKKPKEFKYMSFDITSPTNNQTIRNSDVVVSLKLKPGLNSEENHSIWMLIDGKPVVKNTQSLSIDLGRLNRGAYKLQAQIRDKVGKVIVRTRTTVVFIHQASPL